MCSWTENTGANRNAVYAAASLRPYRMFGLKDGASSLAAARPGSSPGFAEAHRSRAAGLPTKSAARARASTLKVWEEPHGRHVLRDMGGGKKTVERGVEQCHSRRGEWRAGKEKGRTVSGRGGVFF